MLALAGKGSNDDTPNGHEGWLNSRRDRGPNDVMSVLAKRAILMAATVHVDVSQLKSGAKGQKYGDNRDQQAVNAPVIQSLCKTPSHTCPDYS